MHRTLSFKRIGFKRETVVVLVAALIGSGNTLLPATAGAQGDSTCVAQIHAYRNTKTLDTAFAHVRANMIECVDQFDRINRTRALNRVSGDASRITRVFMEIPEFHDEGRLPAGNDVNLRPVLGPMAHIYASPGLGSFTRRAQIREHGIPGVLAAYVLVQVMPGEVLPGTYRRLHLQNGMNCVYLYLPDANPATQYRAYVTRADANLSCRPPVLPLQPLSVVAVHNDTFNNSDDYPPVARFDVDQQGRPVLAFKCLDAFCEIGATPATVRTPSGLPANAQSLPRQLVIKGWHDEQNLAVRGTDNIWRPSNLNGTITPEDNAAQLDAKDFDQTWHHVANLTIRGAVTGTKYAGWGLSVGVNEIWLTHESTGWKAQIRGPGSTSDMWRTWTNVQRMVHRDFGVPATARFRWTAGDDGIWIPCGNACCRADGT